ncbi:MAG: K(+)-transporting ATPase subunit F [Thermoguttaceae bacterium]|jgi:K+-transporting ATPase KdpF subunit
MDWTMTFALVIGVLLCVYLLVALLNPERFS